jgi:hypothetical protein
VSDSDGDDGDGSYAGDGDGDGDADVGAGGAATPTILLLDEATRASLEPTGLPSVAPTIHPTLEGQSCAEVHCGDHGECLAKDGSAGEAADLIAPLCR